MNEPFKWDDYSDQPALLQDRNYKKQMRKKEFKSLLYMLLSSLVLIPFSIIMMPFIKRKEVKSSEFFSLGVDYQRETSLTQELLDELEVKNILLRFKLWEMETLDELKDFITKNRDKKIILKILQDREHIEDLALLKKDLHKIFSELRESVAIFEIGSTINRAKWGFFSAGEYLKFYQVASDLKNSEFQDITLIGSGVIDFEFYYTIHTLFNFCKCKYDGIASLLYVDRRGAPENTQLGFTLADKIALLSTMVWLSPKTKQNLYITETNWPISGTAPFAPTSEHECVSQEVYSDFMLRYYLLAFASQQVNSVSWHQLIAPGYGLIDNRKKIKKRDAFYVFKYMVQTLKDRLKAPKLKEDGSVDMRDFGKLASVKPGELLIQQQPATPGQEGFTVLGDVLPAKPGQVHTLIAGEGTEISKNNPMELLSTFAGAPVEINNGMRVDDIFTVTDVSVKTGHIDFEGSVIVSKNVEPGMRINATGDITVFGTVESGELTAGGDITVKQGVIGHQKPEDKSLSCRIICAGDVHASHSQYCYIEAKNILLDRQASHCSMKAKSTIQIGQSELSKGKLFGGEILDATKLIAGEIGNESGAKMVINLAASANEMTKEIDKSFSELTATNEQVDSLQAALEKADLIKEDFGY